MKNVIIILDLIISILLIVVVLLQAKGGGLGSTFGQDSSFYRSKRGVEKLFVYITIGLTALFFLLSTLMIIL